MKKMEKALVVMTLSVAVMASGATLATMQENRNQNQNGNGNRNNGNMSSNRNGNRNMNSNTGGNMNGNMNANMGGNMNSNMGGNMNMSGNMGGSISDTEFATMAAQGGIAEVQMAQLAQQKSTNKAVQKYARQMIKDHTKANNNLMKIAAKKQMTLPTAPNEEQAQMLSQLQQASGAEFDRMYMEMAGGAAHQKMLGLFQTEASNGTDAELKSFAAKTLPTVQKHLRMAQETMNDAMNSNSNRNSNSNSNR